ncbi:hypothetical protein [Algiphilus sp.]|uniref:hypothetical protein n=1 Tax=Algiphilus sp. TaxID=1872431 RepID=UPI0025BB14B5|nr:hypothetical protein [Algiphilus sp.]MCK5771640.1 hypothetical protein [Algiphilus sp.]
MPSEIISSLSHAISIAYRLKEVSENVKSAEFKNLLADLSLELADVKLKLASVLEENIRLAEQVRELEAVESDPCPKCRKRTWELEVSKPHPDLGELGVVMRYYKCTSCGHAEQTTVTP